MRRPRTAPAEAEAAAPPLMLTPAAMTTPPAVAAHPTVGRPAQPPILDADAAGPRRAAGPAPGAEPPAQPPLPGTPAARPAHDLAHDLAPDRAHHPAHHPAHDTAPALYLAHFGLAARPFTLVPDPDFLFWSRAHSRAYAILEYGVLTRAPITLVTGAVGAGKTTLLHHLLRRLGPDVRVGLVSNAHGARGELLRWILMALGESAPAASDYVSLFSTFQRLVIAEYAAGRRVVLIFDEAQNLGRDVLEELRLLTNINANGDELLQLILVGQPELREIVQRPDMAQFTQRVAARFHLSAMDADTVRDYIEHRLAVAGARYMLFEDAAVTRIHRETRGIPRLVNQLCDLSLVYAYSEDAQVVSEATVAHVIEDGVFVAGPEGADSPTHTAAPSDGGSTRHG
ncbi:MAG: AAA family ATPase [Alkalilacustris sp.]